MKRLLGAGTASLLVAIGLLGGCFDGKSPSAEHAFEALAAPSWAPGYSWTYLATQTYSSTDPQASSDGTQTESHSNTVTLSVFNDSQPVQGQGAYYLRSDQPLEHPLFQGSEWALSKKNLATLATGGAPMNAMAEPAMCMMEAGGSVPYCSDGSRAADYDPCHGVQPLAIAPPSSQPQAFDFPLTSGKTWEGEWNGDVPMPLHYKGEVHGMSKITTPAGTLEAVHVTLDLSPSTASEDNAPPMSEGPAYGFPGSVHITVDNWYSPDAAYLAKSVFTFSTSAGSPFTGQAAGFSATFTLELESYSHGAAAAEPAPPAVEMGDPNKFMGSYTPYQIVTDATLPGNAGNGPVTAHFGLATYERPRDNPDPKAQWPPKVDAVPASVDFDHSNHEVLWVLHLDSEGKTVEGRGDTFTYNFTQGGAVSLHARIIPTKCGGQRLGSADTSFSILWEKTHHLSVDPGAPRTIDVASFPVTESPATAYLAWTWKPTVTGQRVDDGAPLLVDPAGKTAPTSQGPEKTTWQPTSSGTWKLEWNTKSPTIGDDVDILVHIEYEPGPLYLPSP